MRKVLIEHTTRIFLEIWKESGYNKERCPLVKSLLDKILAGLETVNNSSGSIDNINLSAILETAARDLAKKYRKHCKKNYDINVEISSITGPIRPYGGLF
ncbi:hypothetical protein LCGC14_2221700 [marine sediment metagenome]|uniref:Uncharacterized protein n=1 Tax=marine sediment metagenome TaxID=412755 RepID=A0A0F9FND8_9ZZZZ